MFKRCLCAVRQKKINFNFKAIIFNLVCWHFSKAFYLKRLWIRESWNFSLSRLHTLITLSPPRFKSSHNAATFLGGCGDDEK